MPRKRGKKWYYAIPLGNGKRYRKVIPHARTKAEALDAEAAKRTEFFKQSQGVPEPPKRFRFAEFTKEKYLPFSKNKVRPKYWARNVRWPVNKLNEQFGKKYLEEVTHIEFEKWLREEAETYSDASINHFIKRMRAIFNYAVEIGTLTPKQNVMRLVTKWNEKHTSKRRLSKNDEAAITNAAFELGLEYVADAMTAILETGLRPSEFYEMARDQVKLSEGHIIAHSEKGGGSSRLIPLTARAREVFERFLQTERRAGFVFPYQEIKHKVWKAVRDEAAQDEPNCKGFWFRWLRDEAENRWIEKGMHSFDVMLLMGHSRATTSLIYNNPTKERLLNAMQPVTNPSQATAQRSGLRLVNG